MPIINIPKGSKITTTDKETIEIQIPNTDFILIGEQNEDFLWNVFLTNPRTHYREALRKNVNTQSFRLFTNIILRSPFPFQGKQAEHSTNISQYIKKLTKKSNATRRNKNSIRNKSSKLQTDSKRSSKNGTNLSKTLKNNSN